MDDSLSSSRQGRSRRSHCSDHRIGHRNGHHSSYRSGTEEVQSAADTSTVTVPVTDDFFILLAVMVVVEEDNIAGTVSVTVTDTAAG